MVYVNSGKFRNLISIDSFDDGSKKGTVINVSITSIDDAREVLKAFKQIVDSIMHTVDSSENLKKKGSSTYESALKDLIDNTD